MPPYAIRAENLTRAFGPLRAVDRLSIEVPLGSIFGFLGPNGAGKTTTIRLLLGLLEPSAGRAEVLGFDIRAQADQIRQQARIRQLLTHLGLWERRKETVGAWSRGMKQKLAVARALLHRPALILTQ
jgi:ABC-2 type transport system ATP-binding protein